MRAPEPVRSAGRTSCCVLGLAALGLLGAVLALCLDPDLTPAQQAAFSCFDISPEIHCTFALGSPFGRLAEVPLSLLAVV
jgi:hypothetical protein